MGTARDGDEVFILTLLQNCIFSLLIFIFDPSVIL